MSIKIYTAYKMKRAVAKNPTLFWKWLRETRARGELEVRKVLRNVYASMMDSSLYPEGEEYKTFLDGRVDKPSYRLDHVHEILSERYRAQSVSHQRDMFDFDVSITIRELDGNLYLIPYCDMQMKHALNFLSRDPRLEDFAYWNNVDMPEGMSDRRWRARGRVWNRLDPDDDPTRWRTHLVVVISDVLNFYLIDPYMELRQKLSKI